MHHIIQTRPGMNVDRIQKTMTVLVTVKMETKINYTPLPAYTFWSYC